MNSRETYITDARAAMAALIASHDADVAWWDSHSEFFSTIAQCAHLAADAMKAERIRRGIEKDFEEA